MLKMCGARLAQLTDELIYFRSTGEPFGWSKIPTTELQLDMTASSNMQSVVLADASKVQTMQSNLRLFTPRTNYALRTAHFLTYSLTHYKLD